MLRRENILITEDYMSKTTSATHFTAPGGIEYFDSSIHFGKESDRVEIQNCNIKNNVLVHCSKEDTYDFETGALIALMKMCGSDKVVRACNEVFSYERDIKVLRKDNNNLREANKGLQEEVKRLKGESESHWKIYQRNIQKKQDRINELERAYKASNDDEAKLVEYYQREIKWLEAENEKLKLDCEKLQHGYVDTDNVPSGHWDGDILDIVFLPGRACGKQYTALVDLFKKIDQKKVDAAYKEAYNTTLPVWQKEVFKQLRKDQLDSLLEAGKYVVPTKREEMWGKILGDYKYGEYLSVKVEKASINDFLQEAEENGILWGCGEKPTEHNYWDKWKSYHTIVFRIRNFGKIKELTWGTKPKENTIDYLPPMRWDLFKKGRIVVGVRNNNELVEFRKEVEKNTGIKNIPMCPTNLCLFYSFDKDDYKIILVTIGEPNSAKINNHKVVYWEDVR